MFVYLLESSPVSIRSLDFKLYRFHIATCLYHLSHLPLDRRVAVCAVYVDFGSLVTCVDAAHL